jgi:hypothetical protein
MYCLMGDRAVSEAYAAWLDFHRAARAPRRRVPSVTSLT